jgi:lysophospholipase L1-like esterase
MRTRTKILVTLAAGLLGFLGVEVVVRVAKVKPMPGPLENGTITRKSDDPRLRVELLPGGTLHTAFTDRHDNVLNEVDHFVNEQGFRGPTVEKEKPEGVYRIVCLGDSQTYGNGVGEEDTWPAVLTRRLRMARPEAKIEVMNCGVGGYETEQEVAYLESRLLAYDPDLVILGFFMNDPALPDAHVEPPEGTYNQLIHFLSPGRDHWLRAARNVVRTLDLGCDWLFRRLTMRRWIVQRAQLYDADFAGWIRVQAALRHAREILAARGARFAVLLVPLLMREENELVSSLPYRTVSAFCRADGIPYFDPEPLFAGMTVDDMRVHPRDLHTDPVGNRIVGAGLARWLEEQGLDREPAER